MMYDFNIFEQKAAQLIDSDRHADAIKLYLFMADGDDSLDAGYLGMKIAECYEGYRRCPMPLGTGMEGR